METLYAGVDQTKRYEAVAEGFRKRFSEEPTMFVSAPGRAEIIGNHTDHNRGRVLAASVDMDIVAAVRRRDDMRVEMYSDGYSRPFKVSLQTLKPIVGEQETTLSLIRGVAGRLNELGYEIGGFSAYANSTVLKGSGLSSSAAVEVLLGSILNALYNEWKIDPKTIAQAAQYAENNYFGKPSGLMDQMASAMGDLVAINFGPEAPNVETVAYDFGKKGYDICVVSAGGEHGNLTEQYAAIPAEMKDVAIAMGKEVLGSTTATEIVKAIPMLKNKVPDRAILRALHFADETERVRMAVEALKKDDIEAFFSAINESGESSWKLLQNIFVPNSDNQEMSMALEMSRRYLEGRGAWRIHGGGFAGTILAFVPKDVTEEYRAVMDATFGEGAVSVLAIRPTGPVYLK